MNMKKYLIAFVLVIIVAGGAYYFGLSKKENIKIQEPVVEQEQVTAKPVSETPAPTTSQNIVASDMPKGESTLKILCSSNGGCNTSGVNSTRSDFFVVQDNKKIKVLVDIETRLRFVRAVDVEDVVKWADFYPLINSSSEGGMPFGATIYGSWVDENTFKADWIKWTIG